MTEIPLFADGDLSATLDAQLNRARRAVEEIPEERFRAIDPSDIANELFARFNVEPVSLTEGAISVQAEDADIDRRKFRDLDWGMPGASPTLRGTRIIYNVPFTGDPTIFRLRPSTWTTTFPHAVLASSELRFVYEVRSSEVTNTKTKFERDLSLTRQWLGWGNKEVTRFGEQLAAAIERAIDQRSSRLRTASEGLAALGLPVRESEPAKVDSALISTPAATTTSGDIHPPGRRYDIALSFAGEDRPYVHEVANYLKETGAHVFYDEFERVGLWGKDLVEHLQDIYQNQARFCVLFVSQHYVSKPWPTHERRSAQARALVAREEYLLPARFDDSTVPGLPPTIGFVDLRTLSSREFADLVLAKIGISAANAQRVR